MRPQLACGKLLVTCVTVPSQQHRSHGSPAVAFPRNFRLCRQSKKMRVMAAVHRNEAMEMAPPGLRLREGDQVFVSSVGVPAQESLASFRDWYMADKQLVVISFSAVVTAGFMTMLLGAAIPSLIAMKKAAEALEKLADTAREELPGTMAAIRLSGMEISDLTMELNDLGQEISKGVRSSARALNASESVMRQVGVIASDVWQKKAVVPVAAMQPLVARTAKQVSERFVQTRTLVVNLQIMSRVSSWIPVLAIPFQSKKGQSSSSTSG